MDKNQGNDIRRMFDGIAPRYDFLNRLLSFGIDCWWRRKAVLWLDVKPGERLLDMASGTADIALQAARRYPEGGVIVAADLSPAMLKIARQKIHRAGHRERICPVIASCEEIPFPDGAFDAAIIAFGIRNVSDRRRGLEELCRVLRPGGRLLVLEFSTPTNRLFRPIYHFYFQNFLPWLAGFFSSRAAYHYLPRSVADFPTADRFRLLMEEAGLENIVQVPWTFGIVTIHCGFRGK